MGWVADAHPTATHRVSGDSRSAAPCPDQPTTPSLAISGLSPPKAQTPPRAVRRAGCVTGHYASPGEGQGHTVANCSSSSANVTRGDAVGASHTIPSTAETSLKPGDGGRFGSSCVGPSLMFTHKDKYHRFPKIIYRPKIIPRGRNQTREKLSIFIKAYFEKMISTKNLRPYQFR